MCTRKAEEVKTETPLIAYKVVGVTRCGRVCTPFLHYEIEKDILEGKESLLPEIKHKPFIDIVEGNTNVILKSGYIHTYADKDSLVYDYFNFFERNVSEDGIYIKFRVYEVEIPAGCECWKGMFDYDSSNLTYASTQIVFKREVQIEELIKWREEVIERNETTDRFPDGIGMPLCMQFE